GTPRGSSPMRWLSCAPTGLKYLSAIACIFLFALQTSRMISSHICFVFPYGDSAGLNGVDSVTGNLSGCPYTVQEEEKTMLGIPVSCIPSRRNIMELRLLR